MSVKKWKKVEKSTDKNQYYPKLQANNTAKLKESVKLSIKVAKLVKKIPDQLIHI